MRSQHGSPSARQEWTKRVANGRGKAAIGE